MRSTFIAIFGFLFLTGCGEKPAACLSSDPKVVTNQMIEVKSCSSNVDAYLWKVDGGGETIISGGDYCDGYIIIKFTTKGEKTIRLTAWKFKKKSKITCAEDFTGKTDEASYTMTVE